MDWKNLGVAVTGGAGFIGSHLVDKLVGRGAHVEVVDNFIHGKRKNLSQHAGQLVVNMADLSYRPPVFMYGDVVFHLAAKVAAINYNLSHHYDMMVENLRINTNVIEAVRQRKPQLFVFVSTTCIYPHDAPIPTPESAGVICNPEPTNWGYGVAKWVGEQAAMALCREYGIPTIVVRFWNAFGPRDYYDKNAHVAPALIRRVMDGENPLVVWGSGQQSRALIDARDLAKALVLLAETPAAADAQPVNIGHAHQVTMNELARMIIDLCGADCEIVNDPTRPDGHARRAADTTRLRQLVGWIPDTPLEHTLSDMVDEYRKGEAHL